MGYRNFIYHVKMMHRRCGLAESISKYPRRLNKHVGGVHMYCKFYLFALVVLEYQTLWHLGYLNLNSKPHKKASTLSCVLFLLPWPLGHWNWCLLMWNPWWLLGVAQGRAPPRTCGLPLGRGHHLVITGLDAKSSHR